MNQLYFGTGASSCKDYAGLKKTIHASLKANIFRFDTAPSYGTELILAKALKECCFELSINRSDIIVQTKIDAWQMQKGNVERFVLPIAEAFDGYVDTLLIHWPVPEYFDDTWNEMCNMKNITKQIGVCNVRVRQLERLVKLERKPDIIQIERHPLRNCQTEIDFCKMHEIDIQAYSPLCKMDDRLKKSDILESLTKKYSKNIGQIILRWHIDTGVSPIFTSTKVSRIDEYSNIFDFKLDAEDVNLINSMNIDYKMYLESVACPGF